MDYDDLLGTALSHYDDKLLESVASKLFRPKIGQPTSELIERIRETLKNPPVIDRILKSLPVTSQKLLAILSRSHQPNWTVEDLLALSATFGDHDGFPVVVELLQRGLLFALNDSKIRTFEDWFASIGTSARVLIPELVLRRALALPLVFEGIRKIQTKNRSIATVIPDGLDWLLRLAYVRQQIRTLPVKLTGNASYYKRDLSRFREDKVLHSPLDGEVPVDAGLLALSWSRAAGLAAGEQELIPSPWPASWSGSLEGVLADLYSGLFAIDDWDALEGYSDVPSRPACTAGLLLVALLSQTPDAKYASSDLAAWLWEHHPHWPATLSKKEATQSGSGWIDAWFAATLIPLGFAVKHNDFNESTYGLTDLGRQIIFGESRSDPRPGHTQTLLVQPNSEILAYRQGLTPSLIASLSSFAAWKQIGSACTLELTADSVTRGLEDGYSLENIFHNLDRHGIKPVPANVHDSLRRWADRRERVIVFTSATLVEFGTPAELDTAMARGIVTLKLNDRIGLTTNGAAPDFKHLRLMGNRDYESKHVPCVMAEDDGVTLRVDVSAADLLLDAEIARFAELLPTNNGDARRYRITPASLRGAGQTLQWFDEWFQARSGEPMPPAARLFLIPESHAKLIAQNMLVVHTPTAEVADGVMQWPITAAYSLQRLGPTAIAIDKESLESFRASLAAVGITIQPSDEFNNEASQSAISAGANTSSTSIAE